MRARCGLAAVLLLGLAAAWAVAQAAPEAEVVRGVQQVRAGDFEGAVATLDAALSALRATSPRAPVLVQGYVNLGVAQVALDQGEAAGKAFKEALALDPALRLGTDRYSPKVVRAFEAARGEAEKERAAAQPRRKGAGRAALVAGGAAAAAGAVVIATRGGGDGEAVTFGDARFGTPVLVCLDGSVAAALPFDILVEAHNARGEPVRITDVTSTIIIRASPVFPGEIGFANSEPTVATPSTIPGGGSATVRLASLIVCGNGIGDAPRFNEWSGRVTLTTSAGVFTLETRDLMRINLP